MATITTDMADTMVTSETEELLRRDLCPFIVNYKGKGRTVDLPDYYPESATKAFMSAKTWR